MRLLIFGLAVSSSWGNGHATVWRGLCCALGRAGHRITFFERDVPYYRSHRDLLGTENYELCLYQDWSDIEPEARRALKEADCAVVTSYCPDARSASDLILDSPRPLHVFYDLDTPVTLNVLGRQGERDYIPAYGLGPFDLVLSYTGGRALEQLRSRLGARRVAPLYGSVDPSVHKRVPPRSQYASDLSYLGTYAADRQLQLEDLFLKPARQSPDRKWPWPAAFPCCASPWTDTEGLFRAGRDYLCVPDGRAMRAEIENLLRDEAARRQLASSGLETIRRRYTCAHRAEQFQQICEDLGK